MRLQKEEKIVVVLLLMALGSLAVAFWTFGPDVGEARASSDSVAPRGLRLQPFPGGTGFGDIAHQERRKPSPQAGLNSFARFHSCQRGSKRAPRAASSRCSHTSQRNGNRLPGDGRAEDIEGIGCPEAGKMTDPRQMILKRQIVLKIDSQRFFAEEGELKALVFGGTGKIGSAVAWDLAKFGGAEIVGIAGRSLDSLQKTQDWIGSEKVATHLLDVNDARRARELMQEYDVGIIALPDRRSSYRTVETAIGAGLDVVDILEEYHRRPDPYETEGLETPAGMGLDEYGESLHRRALDNGVTLLDGMGFAPGLSNITLAEGIRKVDADHAVARVGGIPSRCRCGPSSSAVYDHLVLRSCAARVHGQSPRIRGWKVCRGGCYLRPGELPFSGMRTG